VDYYRILEVDRNASPEVIKKVYRALSLKYHPDRATNGPDAGADMTRINEAYTVLSDPKRRRAYDESRLSWEVWLEGGLIGLARNWLKAGLGAK